MSEADRLSQLLNFSIVLPGRLAGMAWPFRRGLDAAVLGQFLEGQQVAMLVNLSGEAYAKEVLPALGKIQLLAVDVEDYAPPSLQQLDLVWTTFERLEPQRVMALHCAAGMGRTGTFLACLGGRSLGLEGVAALAWIRQLRPGSVETMAQEERVLEWLDGHSPRG